MKKILILVCLLSMAVFTRAYNNTYVVIVAVADYKNFSYFDGDLQYTVNDAKCFYNFLRSKKGGSVPASNIVYLTDANASKANIIAKGKALFSKAKKNDRVIFYFSGHGDRGCFLPYDAGSSSDSYLFFSEVKSIFRSSESDTKLLFADACFSGSMKANQSKEIKASLKKEARASSKTNIAVMMSCRGNETSMESSELQQGVFTYYLIKGLGGLANSDGNKYVTIKELYYYVYKKTTAKAASMGSRQTPELFGKFDLRLIVANE